jgi:hypothetical protein
MSSSSSQSSRRSRRSRRSPPHILSSRHSSQHRRSLTPPHPFSILSSLSQPSSPQSPLSLSSHRSQSSRSPSNLPLEPSSQLLATSVIAALRHSSSQTPSPLPPPSSPPHPHQQPLRLPPLRLPPLPPPSSPPHPAPHPPQLPLSSSQSPPTSSSSSHHPSSPYNRTFNVKDEECLLWIKDPSFSPFEKRLELRNSAIRGKRMDILNEEKQKNPRYIFNKIKRKCFYNSALRKQIVEKITEYKNNGTLRLYPYYDGITFEYSTPPFKKNECEAWAKNHTTNPRTQEYLNILDPRMISPIYMELLYTTMQRRLPTPAVLNENPYEWHKASYDYINNVIIKVKKRLALIEETDKYFLDNSIGTIDLPKNASRKKNTFDVSTSSSSHKSLSPGKQRKLMDMMLEKDEEEKLVEEFQHTRYLKKAVTRQDQDKMLFISLVNFLNTLSIEVEVENRIFLNTLSIEDENMTLIERIVNKYDTTGKGAIIDGIMRFFNDEQIREEDKANYFNGAFSNINPDNINPDNINFADIIKVFIRNIYSQLLNPTIERAFYIECFSYYNNCISYFKNTQLLSNIRTGLVNFMNRYTPKLDKRIHMYILHIIDDVINVKDVEKMSPYDRDKAEYEGVTYYRNDYYWILKAFKSKVDQITKKEINPIKELRLPSGMGLFTDIKVPTKSGDKIIDRLIVDTNPHNNFTYEECKNWVKMPIFNPRTFKPIKIDSLIYNRLLCMSLQYDIDLIPRMITFQGFKVINLLIVKIGAIVKDVKNKGKRPQTRVQLEEYIRMLPTTLDMKPQKKGILTKMAKIATKAADGIKRVFGMRRKEQPLVKWVRNMKPPIEGTEITYKDLALAIKKDEKYKYEMPTQVLISSKKEFENNSYITVKGLDGNTYYYKKVTKVTASDKSGRRETINRPVVTNYKRFDTIYTIAEYHKWYVEPSRDPKTYEYIYKDSAEYNAIFKQALLLYNKDILPYYISEKGKKFRKKVLKTLPEYFSIRDCLRWVSNPMSNPKTGQPILQDSAEYNRIFERALLYDSNMQPYPISELGQRFKKVYLAKKYKLYDIDKFPRQHGIKTGRDSDVCNKLRSINEGEKSYKEFKYKMLKSCAIQPYNSPIAELKTSFKKTYKIYNLDYNRRIYIDYYIDSAIASVIIYFNKIRNHTENPDYNDVFTNNYTRLNVSILEINEVFKKEENEKEEVNYTIRQNEAADVGGVTKQFLTTFFEELFCDSEHLTRPFIRPDNNKEGKYYINPNFEPDEGFKKVITVYKMKNPTAFENQFKKVNCYTEGKYKYYIKQNKIYKMKNPDSLDLPGSPENPTAFKKANNYTESDYNEIYNIIGKVLSAAVVNDDIMIPKSLSTYILTGLIKQPRNITLYDLLYFYLCEFENALVFLEICINMMSKTPPDWMDDIDGSSFNDYYKISKNDQVISKENCRKFILQLARHIITKNFLFESKPNSDKNMRMRYMRLFAGFSYKIRTTLAEAKINVEDFESMITISQLNEESLKDFANEIGVGIRGIGINNFTQEKKNEIISEMKLLLYDIITQKQEGETDESHTIFIRRLLQFWSATTQLKIRDSHEKKKAEEDEAKGIAKVNFYYTMLYFVGDNTKRLPQSHTCFERIDFFGFPDKIIEPVANPPVMRDMTYEEKKRFLYDKLYESAFGSNGIDNN